MAEPPLRSPPPPAGPPPPAAPVRHPFVFHGEWREYFRIWIVNTLLTLLTAGLFSAWAKVRKRRYLRGNTELMGHRFDYRADPRRILLGNVVVATLFLAYSLFGKVYPAVAGLAVLAMLVLLPWIIIRSLAFNAHNTTYRGLRFYFHQTYGMAALVYLAQGLLLLPTLGFYYPAWLRRQREFILNHHRLGDAFFRFNGSSGAFYSAYLIVGGLFFGGIIVAGIVMTLTLQSNGHKIPTLLDLAPIWICYGLVFLLGRNFIYARIFNHVWNHTKLDEHRFVANMQAGQWIKLQVVNFGAMLISAGLLYPWAAMRSTRYALSCLQLEPAGPIERIARLGQDTGSALGDSAGEFIGMDIGL